MIIVRSPLRISIGGGGTDLPSYYEKFGGFLIAAAIDKYVYITIHDTFQLELILKYANLERVTSVEEIKHPIIRECLKLVGHKLPNLEITSMADIPAGTGLGSSGSFTTALLKALHAHQRNLVHPQELAEQACHIEIDVLKEPIGKQDQYIAAYGGVTCLEFDRGGKVHSHPAKISRENLYNLEDNLVMFFTGYSRQASSILQDQDQRTKQSDSEIIENLHFVKELGYRIKDALEKGELAEFGRMMHEHWQYKKRRLQAITNPHIDELYEEAMKNGALGGKLVGAGGGGFLLFYTEHKKAVRRAMFARGLREVRFHFDFEGTKIIV